MNLHHDIYNHPNKKLSPYLVPDNVFLAHPDGHVEAVGAAAGAGWQCLELPYGSKDYTPTADPIKIQMSRAGSSGDP